MRKYCKAYHLKDLQQFSSWLEKIEDGEPELSGDDICYLWDDFTVVRSPVREGGVLFEEVTPEWRDFCTKTLEFEVPADLLYVDDQPGMQRKNSDESVKI